MWQGQLYNGLRLGIGAVLWRTGMFATSATVNIRVTKGPLTVDMGRLPGVA